MSKVTYTGPNRDGVFFAGHRFPWQDEQDVPADVADQLRDHPQFSVAKKRAAKKEGTTA